MAWDDYHVVVFRGNSIEDPEDTAGEDYIEQAIAIRFLTPNAIPIRKTQGDGTARLYTRSRLRRKVDVECWPFIRAWETDDDEIYQHVAHGQRLIEQVLAKPTTGSWYTWIYRTYRIGSNPAAGPIPRAVALADGTIETDMVYWAHVDDDENGTLPLLVVVDGDLEMDAQGGGFYDLSFTLLAADPM